jgi:hypothetical protein
VNNSSDLTGSFAGWRRCSLVTDRGYAPYAEFRIEEHLNRAAVWPSFCVSCVPFPLTPALSPGAREQQRPVIPNSKALRFAGRLPTVLPLHRGEGRGEGEPVAAILCCL